MFGLEFLFSAALWALPLAGLPVILHLLFRRKSPEMDFSTLRFIRASLQRTAARRRVHQWLLLAVRIGLLALLIWAVAQPARMLANQWLGAGRGVVAAIVVDTSYSNRLRDDQATLLSQADQAVQSLLRDELSTATIAVYPSAPDTELEKLRSASAIQSQWRPLTAQAAPRPLIDRIDAAANMLKSQNATDRWLIILSDLQSRELPRPIPPRPELRTILLDLHPDQPRSAGVAAVRLEPAQPIPGIESKAVIQVVGRAGDSRAVTLRLTTPDGRSIAQSPPQMAHLDASGRAEVRFDVQLPPERRLLVTAQLQGEDAMPWDDARALLVEIPPQRTVTLLDGGAPATAIRYVTLALDPNEGQLPAWPLRVQGKRQLDGDEPAVVAALGGWPDAPTAERLRQIAGRGGTVVLMLQPGMQTLWPALPEGQRNALGALLPGVPAGEPTSDEPRYRANVASAQGALFAGLSDGATPIPPIDVRRLVPFASLDPSARTLLTADPVTASAHVRPRGLLFARAVGAGTVYTLATLPDRTFTDLPMHPTFVPILVRLALPSAAQSLTQNAALGEALTVRPPTDAAQLEIEAPGAERYVVPKAPDGAFVFAGTTAGGLYRWRLPGNDEPLALANVQPPAEESVLEYRPATDVLTIDESVVIARSYDELRQKLVGLSEPSPSWSIPIALVLVLLCAEAALGAGFRGK